MNEDSLINSLNEEVLSAKASSVEVFKTHARHVLANLNSLMVFYNAHRFKRLRFKTYIKSQQAYQTLGVGADSRKALRNAGDLGKRHISVRWNRTCGGTHIETASKGGIKRSLHCRGSTSSALPCSPPVVTPS